MSPLRRAAHPPRSAPPAASGWRMPAEWERQESIWLAWPHDPVTWPGKLAEVEVVYEVMIREIARDQLVDLVVDPGEEASAVRERLRGVPNVRLRETPHADSWIRDYGPTFLVRDRNGRRERAFVDWIFNAWGDKYDTLLPDDGFCGRIAPSLGLPVFEPGLVLEGGAIDVNGAGVVLTTEQCLLHPNRNPHLDRAAIEAYLRGWLGCSTVLWLGEGIEGDDTDGHVDDVARFAAPTTVLAAVEEDRSDPNHAPLAANLERLRRMTDAKGRPLTVVEVPMPGFLGDEEGRLPASYLNFLITNGAVLLPVFGHANDARAGEILRKVFPGRRIVPVPASDLVLGMGTVHCLSQQMPAADP